MSDVAEVETDSRGSGGICTTDQRLRVSIVRSCTDRPSLCRADLDYACNKDCLDIIYSFRHVGFV